MPAATLNLTVEQGATFTRRLTFKDASQVPVDLTGQTFRGSIKRKATDSSAVASFTFTVQNQTTNTGEVVMTLPASVSSAIKLAVNTDYNRKSETFVYDVEREFVDGSVERVLQGTVAISPEVTKS